MQIPSLPTDNLYKFLALSGLIIGVVSLFLLFQDAYRSQELLRQIKENIEVVKALQTLGQMEEALVTIAKSTASLEELKFILEQKEFNKSRGLTFACVGFFLSASGFVLWYVKVQRYQDKILKEQAQGNAKN